jgi:hypothetical protein
MTVEETILNNVLRLLKKDMPDNVKVLTQYFQFFVIYSSQGRHEVSIEYFQEKYLVVFVFSVNN